MTTHFFYEQRSGAWWMDQFADKRHDPLCCVTFDGNRPQDRAALIGSWDGYVRSLSGSATKDDTIPIESEVVIGPLNTPDLDEILVKELQAVLGVTSGDVEYAIHSGATVEEALDNDAAASGTWNAGRNLSSLVRRAGHALYVRISSTDAWAMEQIRVRMAGTGKVRRRGA